MTTPLDDLALQFDLADERGVSPDGLPERYLYSREMTYRYAFARWWGEQGLATTDVWVLLNPATGDTEKRKRPTLNRCSVRSREAGRTGLLIVNLELTRFGGHLLAADRSGRGGDSVRCLEGSWGDLSEG